MTPTEVVNTIIAALGRRDLPAVLSAVAPDAFWQGPPTVPWGGRHVGPDGVSRFFAALGETFELTGLSIREQIADGDRVVTLGDFHGKGRKTGKPAATDFCWVWQIRDGMVVGYQGHFDTAAVLAALH